MIYRIFVFLTLISCTLSNSSYSQTLQSSSLAGNRLPQQSLSKIIVDEFNVNNILSVSDQAIFQTTDNGKSWIKIFSINNEDDHIVFTFFDKQISDYLFAGTSSKLYRKKISDHVWQKILSFDEENISITSFSINPFSPTECILGTTEGLYISKNTGLSWQKENKISTNSCINTLSFHPALSNIIFISTEKTAVILDRNNTETYKTHLSSTVTEDKNNNDFNDQFIFFPANDDLAILLHGKNSWITQDCGKTWQSFGRTFITAAEASLQNETLYFAERGKIYLFNILEKIVTPIETSVHAQKITDLAIYTHNKNYLFAATNKGIFTINLNSSIPEFISESVTINLPDLEKMKISFNSEPSIREVQKAAIKYANVGKDKIQKWHRNSRLRALMPSFSIDFENSVSNNIDIDRGSTSSDDVYIIGPDENDFAWNMGFEWDLANMIWNDDQTAIDYREKYTVELRENILNEVTKLYFERRKLQMQLFLTPPETENTQENLNLCLQIDELTAYLDGLTGGIYSAKFKNLD